MSQTATIRFSSTNGFFARLVASFDRALMVWANASIRNGDVPRYGL